MMKNMQKHQPEIEALAQRAEEAQSAGDQTKLMAIADTLQRLQMGGCR
jgi:membrane protein insertase Oxa1/YidC/SpoIIIJ